MERTDALVWADVCSGKSDQFGVIWDRHHARVFRYLVSAGHGLSESEDLTAVVFLELWRRRTSVTFVDGSVLPWLLATARNVGRNARRTQRRYRAFLSRLPVPDPVPDIAERAAERLSIDEDALRAALADVSDKDRVLLSMTVDGASVRTAADAVGLSEAAAKMRLSRMRTRLRSQLSDGEDATP